MHRVRRSVLAAGAAAVLALPSAAAAQSAGDQQYQDPFPASGGSGGSSGSSGSRVVRVLTTNGELEFLVLGHRKRRRPAQRRSTPGFVLERRERRGQLPATGADVGLIAALGVGLLSTGLGLRLRMPERQRTPAAE